MNLIKFQLHKTFQSFSLNQVKFSNQTQQQLWQKVKNYQKGFRLNTEKLAYKFAKKQDFFKSIINSKNLPQDSESKKVAKKTNPQLLSGFDSYCLGFHTDVDNVVNILIKGSKHWYCIMKASQHLYVEKLKFLLGNQDVERLRDVILSPYQLQNDNIKFFHGEQFPDTIAVIFQGHFHSIITAGSIGFVSSFFTAQWNYLGKNKWSK